MLSTDPKRSIFPCPNSLFSAFAIIFLLSTPMTTSTHGLKQLFLPVWDFVKPQGKRLLKQLGVDVFDRDQTKAYLNPWLLALHPDHQIELPLVRDAAEPTKILFDQENIITTPACVWHVDVGHAPAKQLRCGALSLNHRLLRTDYNVDAFSIPFEQRKRKRYAARTLIAPWSQYFRETRPRFRNPRWVPFSGYYDFMMLVAAKLCRICQALPESALAQSVVAYPLLNTPYEREALDILGFRPDQILDSQHHRVSFETCLLGNSDSWCFPHIADVLALKQTFEQRLPTPRTGRTRIYVRRAGRRHVVNEAALISLLQHYGFSIIDDIPRSIGEQMAIYKNADFIIGPHGASFTNILWCEPGTHLLELFNADYVPVYFRYLSQVLGLRYSAYCFGTNVQTLSQALSADMIVSIPDLEKYVKQALQNE